MHQFPHLDYYIISSHITAKEEANLLEQTLHQAKLNRLNQGTITC